MQEAHLRRGGGLQALASDGGRKARERISALTVCHTVACGFAVGGVGREVGACHQDFPAQGWPGDWRALSSGASGGRPLGPCVASRPPPSPAEACAACDVLPGPGAPRLPLRLTRIFVLQSISVLLVACNILCLLVDETAMPKGTRVKYNVFECPAFARARPAPRPAPRAPLSPVQRFSGRH